MQVEAAEPASPPEYLDTGGPSVGETPRRPAPQRMGASGCEARWSPLICSCAFSGSRYLIGSCPLLRGSRLSPVSCSCPQRLLPSRQPAPSPRLPPSQRPPPSQRTLAARGFLPSHRLLPSPRHLLLTYTGSCPLSGARHLVGSRLRRFLIAHRLMRSQRRLPSHELLQQLLPSHRLLTQRPLPNHQLLPS